MELRSAHFEVICQLSSSGEFPAYKGSMLRGAFGHSLRRAVCTVREGNCDKCLLSTTCPFPQLFVGKTIVVSANQTLTVPPYCIEPPVEKTASYEKESTFTFGLTLFSYATEYLPYFIHAFSLMGQKGLGNTKHGAEGTFSIQDVQCEGTSIYDAENMHLQTFEVNKILPPQWSEDSVCNTQEICHISLATPLRFKQQNHFSHELSFEQIVLLCLRRAKALWVLEGYEYRLESFISCIDMARQVQNVNTSICWHEGR